MARMGWRAAMDWIRVAAVGSSGLPSRSPPRAVSRDSERRRRETGDRALGRAYVRMVGASR
jgi:hypothetical protein